MVRRSWFAVADDEAIGERYELPSERAYAEICGPANETRGRVSAVTTTPSWTQPAAVCAATWKTVRTVAGGNVRVAVAAVDGGLVDVLARA